MSAASARVTLRQAVLAAARVLQDGGIHDATGDARRLVAEACGGDSLLLIREPERTLSAVESARLDRMIRRRAAHEPVSRILGWREFFGRRFAISPDVLDPRPDTETVVETTLEICDREGWRGRPIRILDLGTGSGCILLTLLAELPEAIGTGLDISDGALRVARGNAEALGLLARGSFVSGDMRRADLTGFDLVVSNPPYIASGDIAGLEPEVARYDPVRALDGGRDGLQFYRDILSLVPRGQNAAQGAQWIVLEAGAGLDVEILDFAGKLWLNTKIDWGFVRNDLNGVTRCVALKTRE